MDKIDREIDRAREDKEFQERLRRRHEAEQILYNLLGLDGDEELEKISSTPSMGYRDSDFS